MELLIQIQQLLNSNFCHSYAIAAAPKCSYANINDMATIAKALNIYLFMDVARSVRDVVTIEHMHKLSRECGHVVAAQRKLVL